MPNVACNTSSFLKSNCKYVRTVESESRSQLNSRGGDEMGGQRLLSFWGNYGKAHTCLCVLEYVLELWTVKIEPGLDLEFDGRTDAGLRGLMSTNRWNRKVLKTLIWQKKKRKKKSLTSLHEFMLSDLDNGKKKPTENNQSTSIFQLVWFHLVALVFASVTVLTTRNWWTTCGSERTSPTPQLLRGLAGDGVAACWHPCHLLCLSGTSDAAGGKVWIRLVESLQKGSQLNLECTILACWQIWWTFMSQRRAIMDYSPALWSIEAFSYGLSSPALAPALFCVSFTSPFHFINVSFTAFLSDFLWNSDLFSSFAFLFLVWFWIAPALFFEVTSSVSPSWVWVLFQSSVFDLMVFCVFIKSLLLLNVQSVAFVQGKCLAPVQL